MLHNVMSIASIRQQEMMFLLLLMFPFLLVFLSTDFSRVLVVGGLHCHSARLHYHSARLVHPDPQRAHRPEQRSFSAKKFVKTLLKSSLDAKGNVEEQMRTPQ